MKGTCITFLFLWGVLHMCASGDSTSQARKLSHRHCNYKAYKKTVPYGEANADSITTLSRDNPSRENCSQLCCRAGAEMCQYAWLFNNHCYGVACHHNKTLCEPTRVVFNSTYIMVNSQSLVEVNTSVPTTESSQTTHQEEMENNATSTAGQKSEAMSESPISSPAPIPFDSDTVIRVAVDSNKEIILPENKARVFASTWPKDNGYYLYQWDELFGPSVGVLSGVNKPILSMSKLVEGVYGLLIAVHDKRNIYKDGKAYVNVTVRKAPHKNHPPVVSIAPGTNFTISYSASSDIILDASETKDDEPKSKLRFHWELVVGPLKGLQHTTTKWNQPLLRLTNVPAGEYQFKVTATDQHGAVGEGLVNFTVLPAKDYPPTANAVQAVVVHLPNTEVKLDGRKSSDDKGIKSYLWEQVKGTGCDIQGSNTATPVVSNLQQGLYEFKLVVTDVAGQTSSANVLVDVLAEHNQPPVSDAGPNVTVLYPVITAQLNGSFSSDEYRIVQYNWILVSGPTDIQLKDETSPVLIVSGLHVAGSTPTLYEFNLTVTDYGNLTATSNTFIIYNKNDIIPPTVDAGTNTTITLPQNTVVLNGSAHDGFGIVSYQWYRSESSPAAGSVVGTSDHTPSLMLTDLVSGLYNFTLEVVNKNGVKNSDSVMLTVLEDPRNDYVVELFLNEDIHNFTQSDLDKLKELLIIRMKHLSYEVTFVSVRPHISHILVEFTVTIKSTSHLVNATEVVHMLTLSGPLHSLDKFKVSTVQSRVCHNPCSGRGHCNQRTKRCVCSTFWIENPFTAYFGRRHSNCDWSLFYLVLVVAGVIMIQAVAVWLCCCCCLRRRKSARRKRFKYAILNHKHDNGHMLAKSTTGYSKTSLMVSETDTEEEVLFDSHKGNGIPQITPIEQ